MPFSMEGAALGRKSHTPIDKLYKNPLPYRVVSIFEQCFGICISAEMRFLGSSDGVPGRVDESKSVHRAEKCPRLYVILRAAVGVTSGDVCGLRNQHGDLMAGLGICCHKKISGHARVRKETQKLEMPAQEGCIPAAEACTAFWYDRTPVGMASAISAAALWPH